MAQIEEPAKKLIIHDRVEEFSQKTFEQAEAKKVLVRNLKGLVHKVVRTQRKNLLQGAVDTSLPMDLMQPGSVAKRRVDETEWDYRDVSYNGGHRDTGFQELVGMVKGFQIEEQPSGGSVYLIVAAPNDRFEYKFNIRFSEIEVLDGFPVD